MDSKIPDQASLKQPSLRKGGARFGVNVIADLEGNSGLSEVSRTTLDLIRQQDIPFSYQPLSYNDQRLAGLPDKYKDLPAGSDYPLNLMLYNIHGFPSISASEFARITRGKYTIVNWYWELPEVPQKWLPQFERPDEIWVASKFVQNTFQQYASCPVRVVPPSVVVPVSPDVTRERFKLPSERYIFLFSFNSESGFGRKNPWGIIDAFKKAFGRSSAGGPLVVFKTHNLELFPELHKAFHQAVESVGGVLINENYTRPQTNDLLACADVYISLHRAEGFGLGMAEAMYLGKPVIATNYSANADFMNAENSYLVDYQLRMVSEEDHAHQPAHPDVYEPGLHWAEPNIEQAAEYMQHLVEHPEEGRERGMVAAQYIHTHYNPDHVGQLVKTYLLERFQEIDLRNTATGRQINRSQSQLMRIMRDKLKQQIQQYNQLVYVSAGSIPVVGRLKRLLVRIIRLGQVQAVERDILQHLLDYTDLLESQLVLYENDLAELESQLFEIEMRNE